MARHTPACGPHQRVPDLDALQTSYSNVCPLPYSSFGHSIMPFWDDLYVTGAPTEDISYYNDTVDHALIIKWRAHYYSGSGSVNCQVWLYNASTNPSPTGDSQIKIVYGTMTGSLTSASVGVQSGTTANTYTCNGVNDPNAQGIVSNARKVCYGGCTVPHQGALTGTITSCLGGPACNATVSFPGSLLSSHHGGR